MGGYLEDRLNEVGVGTVCEGCKRRAAPFAVNLARDLEADGLPAAYPHGRSHTEEQALLLVLARHDGATIGAPPLSYAKRA